MAFLTKEEKLFRKNARTIYTRALKSGALTKPLKCSECHREAKIHGHHDDYNKPLSVHWLCSTCHGKRHRTMGLNPIYLTVRLLGRDRRKLQSIAKKKGQSLSQTVRIILEDYLKGLKA